jgi:hypothetical protein
MNDYAVLDAGRLSAVALVGVPRLRAGDTDHHAYAAAVVIAALVNCPRLEAGCGVSCKSEPFVSRKLIRLRIRVASHKN